LMAKLDYDAAAKELQRLSRRHRSNAQIAALQATCCHMLNDTRRARALYEKARSLDSSLIHELGPYSGLLLATSQEPYAVYQLGSELLKVDQSRPEGWVAMARYFLMTGQTQEALAIVWKAQTLAPSHADAYYAEGTIQMASECPEEAAEAFVKAHELERSALTYRGVVEAYVRCGKYKEAFLAAKEAAELMPRSAGALAMVGVVLSHSPESYSKAVKLLEAALDIDHRCTEAIAALASLYVSNERFADAIKLLEKHLPENESDEMFTRYADVLTLANELPKAAVNYTTALSLNPANERAKTGFERVDRLLHP
ncbi:TPR-like protein, partial [Martensiomyces pterosporus]